MSDPKETQFDFVISGLDDNQIEKVWDALVAIVEACGGTVGGGSYPIREAEDEQK